MKTILASLLLASSVFSGVARAQTSAFTAGNREILSFDFSRESAGVLPKGIQPVDGSFSIVEKDGKKMLKVATPSSFLLTRPEVFPQNFTITIRGTGVGIVAIRVLPSAPGSTLARAQAELYVERMDIAIK